MARLPRPHMSLSVKLAACLDALGFEPGEAIDWDHTWALGLRKLLPDGSYVPDANDPRYIRPKRRGAHIVKTRGSGATTAGSDVGNMRHFRNVTAKEQAFRDRMTAKADAKREPEKLVYGWPKRPFQKRRA